MAGEFTGKTALVTGAGRNIGRATILAFAQEGANVVVNYRSNRDEGEGVAEEARALGVEAIAIAADVGDSDQVGEMARQALERFGAVDIVVNNAASRPHQPFMDITVEDWDRVIRTDLSATFYLTRALVPTMMSRGWGRIVIIGGVCGSMGLANRAHTVASKAGLQGLTKAMALEFGHAGINVNLIAPGMIDTTRPLENYPGWPPSQERLDGQPVNRIAQSEELAGVCVFLASQAASYITGQTIHFNGGMHMV